MIKSRAIVLHRYAYSDSSWIVKALTEEVGIVSFIVKGGKRKESPFKGALDPLALSEVVFRQNPNTELQFIKEATLIEWRKSLREDLLALAKAQVMAEIVLRYAPQGVPLQAEFQLLEQATGALDQRGSDALHDNQGNYSASTDLQQARIPKSNIFARWLLDTCDAWGYSLDLATCSRCDKILDTPPADFIPETGAVICKECLGVGTPHMREDTSLGIWNLLTNNEITHPQYVENALLSYLRKHIGFLKEIKSLQFLNETRKLFSN
jgi:DNA repair protein RecO (recombination protein O)